MTQSTPVRPLSAPDRAYQWLMAAVSSVPRDEEAFLTEAEVALGSGLSRTPVREALQRMEAEGLLRRIPNKGAYVPALSDTDVDHLMQARRVVEEWSARTAAVGSRIDLDRLDTIVLRQRELLDDPVDFIAADVEFHSTIVAAGANPVMNKFYGSLRDRQTRLGLKAVIATDARAAQVLAEHQAIVDGIRSGDVDAAVLAVLNHLDSTARVIRGRQP